MVCRSRPNGSKRWQRDNNGLSDYCWASPLEKAVAKGERGVTIRLKLKWL